MKCKRKIQSKGTAMNGDHRKSARFFLFGIEEFEVMFKPFQSFEL
jgi:hypothetical protein